MDLEDRLEVRVIGGDELPEAEGGECNPYVVIRCGVTKSSQTGVLHDTRSPSWAHEERMVFVDLTENGVSHIVGTVYHKSAAGAEDLVLGTCVIDLTTNMLAPGIQIDENYTLDKGGSIRLEMVYFMGDAADLFDFDDDEDSDDEEEIKKPNMVVGTVSRGRGFASAVDSYVSTRIGSHKAKTNLVRKNNAPVYSGIEFRLPCEDGSEKLILKAKQRTTLRNQVIGVATIALVELAAHGETGFTKWCSLLGADGAVDGDARGQIEITLRWIHDKKYAKSLARILSGRKKTGGEAVKEQRAGASYLSSIPGTSIASGGRSKKQLSQGKDDTISDLAALYLAEEEALAASQQELTLKEKEEAEDRRQNLEMMADRVYDERSAESSMPAGDYQIQVQVIEARDLKAEDAGGTSDPYVRIRCLGKLKKSRVIRKVTSCYFGETLFFNFEHLTSAEIERATIDLEVMDYDFFSQHDMIGSTSFDAKKIHAMDNHEFYRKWVGLIDATNDKDTGYQGYLKVSVTVLGPNDEQRVHDADREYQAELALAEKTQEGIALDDSALASSVPVSKLKFLVVYIFAAADVPETGVSGYVFSGKHGCETRVQASFAGVKAKTSIVRLRSSGKERAALAPEFKEELWIPVSEPTEASVVRLGLVDARRNQLVASVALDYRSDVEPGQADGYPRPKWYHLYGADETSLQQKVRFGSIAAAQNRYGFEQGSTYRGRLLAKCCLVDAKQAKSASIFSSSAKSTPYVKPMPTSVDLRSNSFRPTTVTYTLKVLLVTGSELPLVRARGSVKPCDMRLVVSIGRRCPENSLEFSWRPVNRGVATWNELLWIPSIELPVVVDDLPDICLHLEAKHPSKGRGKIVSFARIPAARLLRQRFDLAEPLWESLEREAGTGITAPGINPGAILAQIGLALRQDALELNWPSDDQVLNKVKKTAPYCLRVYVYQAKRLPSSDEDGMLDAYVKVRFRGEKLKTKVATKTTAPLFYETLQFQSHELPLDRRYGPDIVLQVWDQDTFGSNSLVATLRMALPECPVLLNEASAPPTPSWRSLYDVNGTALPDAELLVSAALIKKRELQDKIDRPQSIVPAFRLAFLEVTCIGVRQLRGFRLMPPRRPQLRGDINAPNDGGTYFRTKPAVTDTGAATAAARAAIALDDEAEENNEDDALLGDEAKTTGKNRNAAARRRELSKLEKGGRNANFCERKIVSVEMPENPLYAQHLDLRIYDAGRTGKPLLAACAVDLGPKMPWNRDYEPPQMELYDDAEKRRLKQKADEARKKRLEEQKKHDSDSENDANDLDDDDHRPGRVKSAKVRFADEEEDSDLDENEDDEDSGEAAVQHELEWRKEPHRHRGAEDDGVGAFNPMHVDDLPMIIEDQLYLEAEEQRLKAEEDAADIEESGNKSRKRHTEDSRTYFQRGLSALGLGSEFESIIGGETSYKLSELDLEFPTQWAAAEYLKGRDWWLQDGGTELEHLLVTKPFENYTLLRGIYSADPKRNTLRPVGILKAVIRITDEDPAGDWFVPRDALRPALYCVRLYCIKAANLQPVDADSVDPYLRVKLGSSDVDARPSSHKDRTCDPNLYQTFEFITTLPGPSVLKIQVKDWNRFSPFHALVGETKIDLEDRWYHRDWQRIDGGPPGFEEENQENRSLNKLKPIEVRGLYNPNASSVVQGQLQLWLEIRPLHETRRDPPVELQEPPIREFELRIICWKTKSVPRRMGDFFCKFTLGEERPRSTDVHWRCQTGRASWNWRIKIPFKLPATAPDKCRLAIQLWDQDVIKWNDVIGSATIDLYRWFLLAYRENRTVNVFKEINDALKRLRAQEEGLPDEDDLLDEDDDEDDDDDYSEDNESVDDEDEAGDEIENPLLAAGDESTALLNDDAEDDLDGGQEETKEEPGKKKKKQKDTIDEEDDPLDDGTDTKVDERAEADFFVAQLKDMIGLGDLDDSAQWIKLNYHDHKRHKIHDRGSVAISIEILPKDEAELRPAGHGISSPNQNPTLPPRTGRLSLSLNPFYLLSALCGPEVAATIFICLCVALFLFVWFYVGIYYTDFYYEYISIEDSINAVI